MAAGIPDTVVAASHLINQLQTVVARDINPNDPAVISICYLQAGDGGYNVLPSKLEMRGTIRNFTKDVQDKLRERIFELCAGVALSFRVKITPEYYLSTPCTDNSSPEHVGFIRAAAKLVVGPQRVVATPPVMGAEDFSEFLLRAPGCFIFVGASLKQAMPAGSFPPPQLDTEQHHSPTFDIDERALLVGPSVFLNLIKQQLCSPQPSKL
jgi:amidohydrolase